MKYKGVDLVFILHTIGYMYFFLPNSGYVIWKCTWNVTHHVCSNEWSQLLYIFGQLNQLKTITY